MRFKIHSNYGIAGGQHAMHQLAYILDGLGEDTTVVYPPEPEPTGVVPLYEEMYGFKKFENRLHLHDDPDMIHVLPAGWGAAYFAFDKLSNCCLRLEGKSPYKSKKVFSWLGVGNWQDWDRGGWDQEMDLSHPNLKKAYHGCQSRTAYDFLIASGEIPSSQIFMLRDFTNPYFVAANDNWLYQTFSNRKNIVLYNGAKCKALTQKIIDFCSDLDCQFIKLEGLTIAQIRDLALSAKVYIDFSQHGGRDRLPREMVSCGLTVITGCDGAAFNTVDVPNGVRKFRKNYDGEYILEQIRNMIAHDLSFYEAAFFDPALVSYRQLVRQEKNQAITDTKNMIKILNTVII